MKVSIRLEDQGRIEVQARKVGPFAIHPDACRPFGLFCVTHIRTGLAMPLRPCCAASAIGLAKALIKALPDAWEFDLGKGEMRVPTAIDPAKEIVRSWKCPRGCNSTGPQAAQGPKV